MTGLIIALSITGIILIISSFIVYNLYQQNQQLEEFISNTNKRESKIYEDAEKYYRAFLKLFTEAYQEMERVDKRGSFSSDDEVGFSFKVIITSIKNVKDKLTELKEEQTQEGDE